MTREPTFISSTLTPSHEQLTSCAHAHPLPSAPERDVECDDDPLATPTTSHHYPGQTNAPAASPLRSQQLDTSIVPAHHHGQSEPTPQQPTPTPRAPSPGRTIEPTAPPLQQPPPPSRTYHLGLTNTQVTPPCHPYPPPPCAPFPDQTIAPAASPLRLKTRPGLF